MAMIDPDPRICDLTRHESDDPDSPVKMSEGTPPIDIKLPLLGVLPKFYGKAGEDLYDFLNEFTRLCGIQKRPTGVSEGTFRMAVFSFTLSGEANAWFRRLAPRSIKTSTELKTTFLEYYFPSTKTTTLKKEITSVRLEPDESLRGYWERFNRMLEDCPNYKISEEELIQTFYQGMTFENKHLMNFSSGGKFSRMRLQGLKEVVEIKEPTVVVTVSGENLPQKEVEEGGGAVFKEDVTVETYCQCLVVESSPECRDIKEPDSTPF